MLEQIRQFDPNSKALKCEEKFMALRHANRIKADPFFKSRGRTANFTGLLTCKNGPELPLLTHNDNQSSDENRVGTSLQVVGTTLKYDRVFS